MKAQEKQKIRVDKCRPVGFGVGDKVLFTRTEISTDQLSRILDYQMLDSFEIKKQIGHSYVLDFPSFMKTENLVHADRLGKFNDDSLPGQRVKHLRQSGYLVRINTRLKRSYHCASTGTNCNNKSNGKIWTRIPHITLQGISRMPLISCL